MASDFKIFCFGNEVIPKYSFNAKELDEETGMYYFEARYYRAPTFTSRDPLFEKYFWMSPYAYCANNPVKFVDPTGMEVEIVCPETGNTIKYTPGMIVPEGCSKFVSDAIIGLNFLHDNPEGDINRVADIVNAVNTLTITKGSGGLGPDGNGYDPMMRKLSWNNTEAAMLPNGTGQSPIVGLAHEIDHASLSIPAWDIADKYGQMNAEANSNAFMMREDSRYDSWEQRAVNYENYIGNMSVEGQKLSTYQRSHYVVPEGLFSKKVTSIFSIK